MGMCKVMGIVNVTPDSFSDGGKFNTPDEAIRRAKNLVEEGAEVVRVHVVRETVQTLRVLDALRGETKMTSVRPTLQIMV